MFNSNLYTIKYKLSTIKVTYILHLSLKMDKLPNFQ